MRVKLPVVAMVPREAVVVVIKINRLLQIIVLCLIAVQSVVAAVLPDERIDILYHGYDGGGAEIDGPSILVRKNIGTSVSVSANYYVDMVTSASIDVEATASPYSEERKEQGFSAQYMVDRSTMSLGYVQSKENDYDATTYSFGIDQSFFGDLTTLGFGVSFGEDIVGRNINGEPDPTFKLDMQRRKYSINASQIVTKNLLASISVDSATDQCIDVPDDQTCLNNPYRSIRYVIPNGVGRQPEKYPHTRSSDGAGIRAIYHLPWRGSVRGEYRTFKDSWGVEAQNYELRYTHVYQDNWIIEGKVRMYDQKKGANFYSDLFPYPDPQNFYGRDKELSPFSSTVIGLGVTYKLPKGAIPWFEKSTVNLFWDRFDIKYDDFRNELLSQGPDAPYTVGNEPMYSLNADVIRFYLSFWY
jgi:hypothetical protein